MNLKLITSRIKKLGTVSTASQKKHPQRDWLILVGGTLFLFFSIALWSYISFQLDISGGEKNADKKPPAELKTNSIETVQNIFEKRARMRTSYESSKQFVDPSR